MANKIYEIEGGAVPIRGDEIDTDRIIPARFLKEITFDNMGKYLFYDERFDEQGRVKDHPLNNPEYFNARIMIVGRNFGCGSSREHAPQAIQKAGINALIGESFADIFSGNCNTMGVPLLTLEQEHISELMGYVEENPGSRIRADIRHSQVLYIYSRDINIDPIRFPAKMPESVRRSFVEGTWDTTDNLLANPNGIDRVAVSLPYMNGWE